MSSFVWMKVLESAPERYDRGIRLLSRGRIDAVHRRIAELGAGPGRRVLDVGCGTGGLTLACAARGAEVVGLDRDAGMVEVARRRPAPGGGRMRWLEAGAAELEDHFPPASLDAVVSCLAFSELDRNEQAYLLRTARSRLVPGGVLVIGDEALPPGRARRSLARLARFPLAVATYALTQATTRPVEHLAARVREAGFEEVVEERRWSGTFLIVQARSPRVR